MVTEFKQFLLRGNVIDLAVAVVIGAAFGAVINSLVADLLTPHLERGELDVINDLALPLPTRVIADFLGIPDADRKHLRSVAAEFFPIYSPAQQSQVLEGVGRAAGCRVDFELHKGYPAVVNDPASAANARTVANRVFGEDHVHEPAPMAAAEDFSYFLLERPGAFIFVGAGNEQRGITAPHHSPEFDIDESVLPRGAELLARLALEP